MKPARLGMLTPSSNTVLEPVTRAMLSGLHDVSVHFSRFRVTEIGVTASALAQFDESEMLRAVELLADAKVHVIGWNGTSAGWKGFDSDERLVDLMQTRLGIPACTSVTALNEIFALTGVRRFALVTPYIDAVQARIIGNYRRAGYECVASECLGIADNFAFSQVSAEQLARMVRDAARAMPDAITVFCTNLRGAPLVQELEAELRIPIYDTVATVVWKALKLCGVDTTAVRGWGKLFSV